MKTKMTRLCNALQLSHTENQCVDECWVILFDHYFDILGVSHLYKVEIITCYREIVEPNSRAKPRENKKKPLMQTHLQIHEADLKKSSHACHSFVPMQSLIYFSCQSTEGIS